MPTPRQQLVQISAWSISRLGDYTQCPAKAKYKIIDKLKEPGSAAMDKGNLVHLIAQVYVDRKIPRLERDQEQYLPRLKEVLLTGNKIPAELACFEKEFKQLRREDTTTEQQWAFDRDWNPTDWFASTAWLRMKVDLNYFTVKKLPGGLRETTFNIVDYKTGKFNPDHAGQRSLYALGAFLMYPDATYATAAHWYLDLGEEEKETWTIAQLDALKQEWTRRTTAMLNDKTFAPRPNDKCKWCFFSSAKRADQSEAEKRLHPCQY